MKNRIFALSCMCVLVLNMAASAVSVDATKSAQHPGHLVSLLPAVDGVVAIDAKRFFSAALPKLLAANPAMLGKVTTEIDKMKSDTGVDVRQFDQIVAGFTLTKKATAKDYDVEPIIIARGQTSSAAIINSAKSAPKAKFREEKVGDKTIYLFSSNAVSDQAKAAVAANAPGRKVGEDIAVTVLDANTIAFGDLALVKKTISAQKGTPSAELTSMLAKNEASVVSFAGKAPGGMSSFLPMDNDELGNAIESIRFVYGGMDMPGDSVALNVTARTLQEANAKSLVETLEGLQIIGKAFLGGSKGADKQVYARLIDGAKFSAAGNEVNFTLLVPQSDIDVLVSTLK